MKRTPLRGISARRLLQHDYYLSRRRRFLGLHPYCQVWLAEHDVAEALAIAGGGVVELAGRRVAAPLSVQVHHSNKRRGADLLDESAWFAVSVEMHAKIEAEKDWARMRGYLKNF